MDISGTDTYLEANIVINYGSSTGRRLLSVSRPLDPGSLSVGKKFQLYPVPCENPQTVPGRYVEEPCPFSRKTRVRICSKNGWETVVDDCVGKHDDILKQFYSKLSSWGTSSLLSLLHVSHLDHADWQLLGLFTTTTCAITSLIFFIITKLLGQPEELPKKDSSSKTIFHWVVKSCCLHESLIRPLKGSPSFFIWNRVLSYLTQRKHSLEIPPPSQNGTDSSITYILF